MKNTQGGVRLRDWLREERRTQKWLGEQIGAHQTYMSRLVLGTVPPLSMALAIEKITGIAPGDWLIDSDESGASLVEIEDAQLHARGKAS